MPISRSSPYYNDPRIALQHPLFMGPTNTGLRGVWIRSLRTGQYGVIVHAERPRNRDTTNNKEANRTVLWVIYPPDRVIKTWTAGSLYPEEMRKKPSWGNYFEEEE